MRSCKLPCYLTSYLAILFTEQASGHGFWLVLSVTVTDFWHQQ